MGGERGGESRGPNGIERRATERIARILTQLPAHAQKARKEREPASQPASQPAFYSMNHGQQLIYTCEPTM